MTNRWRSAAILTVLAGAALVIAALVLAVQLIVRNRPAGTTTASLLQVRTGPAIGSLAPDFDLKTLDGEAISLTGLAGKPVVINFWATWCPPCKEEMPLFEEYYNHYGEEFTILAVNYSETETVVRDFIEEYRLTFPVLLDPSDKVNSLYRINGYPTTYFVDAGGNVTNVHVGLLSTGNLKKYMHNLGIGK